MTTETLTFTTDDIGSLRHGNDALRMRLYRPAGAPLPVAVGLPGGARNNNDLGSGARCA